MVNFSNINLKSEIYKTLLASGQIKNRGPVERRKCYCRMDVD